jgi:genome maintenance exonuclease 1
MIKINERFDYPELKRIDGPSRKYAVPTGEKLPSVTTILSSTGDKTALIEWRKRVGEDEANRISKESTGLGTLVHRHVECYLLGMDRPVGNNPVHILARSMSNCIIEQGLAKVDEVWGMECNLYYPGLYAGTTDLVGIYDGKEAVMDHKTSKALKKPEWMEDYFIQTAAYALAHNEVYDTNIERGVLFMAARDGKYQTYIIEGQNFKDYTNKWLKRVEDYYRQH